MKTNRVLIVLALVIIPLALLAAGAGIFWQGTGASFAFDTVRGETVMIRGHGLYFYDTVISSSQQIGQDLVTLFLGIPLMIAALLMYRKGTMRGRLLLTGVFGYFLYTYASMSFLTAFNSFYLFYVALFSLSLFGFILSLKDIDVNEVTAHIGEKFPRRIIAVFLAIVGVFLSLAWLGLVVPPMLTGNPPRGLESAVTMVIQSLDLAVIVPTTILTAVLLLKKQPWGYTLSSVVLLKMLTMGTALIAMTISQMLAGVPPEPVTSVFFVLIGISGVVLAISALRNIRD